jgi:hypothetical protein
MLLKDKIRLIEFIMKIEYLQIWNHKFEIQKLGNPSTLFFFLYNFVIHSLQILLSEIVYLIMWSRCLFIGLRRVLEALVILENSEVYFPVQLG